MPVEFKQQNAEEFVVEEIARDGTVFETGKKYELGKEEDQLLEKDYFTHFVLEKKEWNTLQALGAVAHRVHVKPSRFNFAGTKDRQAITTQLCSAFAVAPERLAGAKVKDVSINGCWKAKEKVRLGDLCGNRFTITLTKENCGREIAGEEAVERARELNYCIPNFFGPQRFGSMRFNTHLVGEKFLKGEYEQAVWEYLCGSHENESKSIREAREKLREEKDFAAALQYFPRHLRYELTMLEALAREKTNFVGAIRVLPRNLQLMFVHAFQSFLFNELLRVKVEAGGLFDAKKGVLYCLADSFGFPETDATVKVEDEGKTGKLIKQGKAFLVGTIGGYESSLEEDEIALLEKHGLTKESFRIKSMPELSSKGSFRPLFVPLKGFEVLDDKPLKLRFALPSGSYATTALQQLLI